MLSFHFGTAECTAVDAFKHAGENIVFASGSPFKNVDLGMVSFHWANLLWSAFAKYYNPSLCSLCNQHFCIPVFLVVLSNYCNLDKLFNC